eukprot:1872783-Prymnesium_polylepis.2
MRSHRSHGVWRALELGWGERPHALRCTGREARPHVTSRHVTPCDPMAMRPPCALVCAFMCGFMCGLRTRSTSTTAPMGGPISSTASPSLSRASVTRASSARCCTTPPSQASPSLPSPTRSSYSPTRAR